MFKKIIRNKIIESVVLGVFPALVLLLLASTYI